MKNTPYKLIIIFILLTAAAGCVKKQVLRPSAPENILLSIKGEPLTSEDVARKIEIYRSEKEFPALDRTTLLDILDNFITLNIFKEDALNQGIQKSDTFLTIVNNFKNELLFQMYQDKLKNLIGPLSAMELYTFYQNNQDLFTEPSKVYIKHLLVDTKQRAQDLLEEIRTNDSFDTVMIREIKNKTARGGDIGYIIEGMLDEPLQEKAFSLQKDEISDIVRSKFGYHILQCYRIEQGRTTPFKQVKDELRKILYKEKLETAITQRLENLKKKYNVQIYDENIQLFIKRYIKE